MDRINHTRGLGLSLPITKTKIIPNLHSEVKFIKLLSPNDAEKLGCWTLSIISCHLNILPKELLLSRLTPH